MQVDSVNMVRFGFERLLNTFMGTGDAVASGTVAGLRYDIRQQLRSRLVRVPGSPRQDEYKGSFLVGYPVADVLSVVLSEESSVLGGSRGAGIEANALHRILAGPEYRPAPGIAARGFVGWETNGQEDLRDDGLSYAAGIDAQEVDLAGVSVQGTGSIIRSRLGERRPEDAYARVRLLSDFQAGSGDSLEVTYTKQVRELYSSVGTAAASAATYLSRSEDVLSVRNVLWFMGSQTLAGSVEGGLVQRAIDRSYHGEGAVAGSVPMPALIDQLMIDVAGRLRWNPVDVVSTQLGFGFASGEEIHDVREVEFYPQTAIDAGRAQARRRSNTYERYLTTVAIEASPVRRGTVRLEGSAGLLRYDTPDTLNTDDRDEQRFTVGLHLGYDISRELGVSMKLEGGQNHLVYLSRFQSANNVRIRTLRLAPAVVWASRAGFRNAMHAEVAASYTVYDYEDLISTVQSFSYRQAAWTDSLTVSLGTRMGLEFFGSLRLFERGIIRWSDFTERPQRAFLELYLWPRLTYLLWEKVAIGIGFRSFRQERYLYVQNVRAYDGAVGSSGPTVSITATVGPAARIMLSGWRETQYVNSSQARSLSNLSLTVETRL